MTHNRCKALIAECRKDLQLAQNTGQWEWVPALQKRMEFLHSLLRRTHEGMQVADQPTVVKGRDG